MASRVTELSNELTKDIDKSDSSGIVRILRQSDAQLFAGYGTYNSIYESSFLTKLDLLASRISQLLLENESGCKNMIVFTGCGTSGRIAWSCSCSFNRLLSQQSGKVGSSVRYLMAGGDKALIVGDELPEDDPLRGAQDLAELTDGSGKVLLVGITCGLSAPYVAGQIDYAMAKDNFFPVLLGFNPVEAARDIKIEKWDKTCKETFSKLERMEQMSASGMIINPVVGPESITGSSRMKGGSMTAIVLDTVFLLSLSRAYSVPLETLLGKPSPLMPPPSPSHDAKLCDVLPIATTCCGNSNGGPDVSTHMLGRGQREAASVLDVFHSCFISAYRPAAGIAALMDEVGACLRHPAGHLYYIGARLFGVVGFIDSSEMVSTFGSTPYEVRGFVEGGWTTCQNAMGDLSEEGELFRISVADFERDILPTLTERDCVLCLRDLPNEGGGGSLKDGVPTVGGLVDKLASAPASCCLLAVADDSEQTCVQDFLLDSRFKVKLLIRSPCFNVVGTESIFGSFVLKLILNVISTGANVLKGRVHHNLMINLKVANDKLFYRSVGIISKLGKVEEEEAREALLKAIYKEEDAKKQHDGVPVSQHIKMAVRQNMVVPLALILASRSCSISEAESLLTGRTALRDVIETSV